MKFFKDFQTFFDYFFDILLFRNDKKDLFKAWHGAGYYWLDSTNNINYSVIDTRLENVPFSTVPKCEVCNALGEICPACGDDEAIPIEKI